MMRSPLQIGSVLTVLMAGLATAQPPEQNALTGVRHWTLVDVTRVVVETTTDFEFKRDRVPNPDRLFFDLRNTKVKLTKKGISTFPVHDARLKQVRVAQTSPDTARVVFDLEPGVMYTASQLSNPARLIVELKSAVAPLISSVPAAPRGSEPAPATVQPNPPDRAATAGAGEPVAPALSQSKSVDVKTPARPAAEPVMSGEPASVVARATPPAPVIPGVVVGTPSATVPPATAPPVTVPPAKTAKAPPAPKPAKLGASQSMTRVLGLKVGRIVLDPGHGGHDTGTIGPGGLYEKDLVLDVCKRLGELIESRLGADVVYTRSDDTFIPLERRTEIANDQKADLFLSIHANSSPLPTSSGVETYYLNFTTSKAALEVAARENAGSAKSVHELKDLLQKIALQDKVDESRQFAQRVQQSVYATAAKSNARTRDRGVRKAPFVVLIGAEMPSVLAEVGFISNPKDEAMFRKPEFRQKIAEGLFQGIARYASTLSQFQVAAK